MDTLDLAITVVVRSSIVAELWPTFRPRLFENSIEVFYWVVGDCTVGHRITDSISIRNKISKSSDPG